MTAPAVRDDRPDLRPAARRRAGADEPIAWKHPPIDGGGLRGIAGAYVVATATLTLVGLAVVEWWEGSRLGGWDAEFIAWFERRRTDRWTTLADVGSGFSDAPTIVALGVLGIPVFLVLFRRWHDHVLIFGGVALETLIFLTASTLVGRDRPPVEQLGGSPTNSFPSGHIAAAVVVYGGFALVVAMQTRRRALRIVAGGFAVFAVVAVVLSRWYLGMHYVTDAVAGLALGVFVVATMHWAVHRTLEGASLPERVRTSDRTAT